MQAYAKINRAGEWIELTENVWLNDLFDRMCTQELETMHNPEFCRNGLVHGRRKGKEFLALDSFLKSLLYRNAATADNCGARVKEEASTLVSTECWPNEKE